jgi:hypothetical protein
VIAFTMGVLGVLAIAALLVPSAEIQLMPETRREQITISVVANPEFQEVDISGTVPAHWDAVIVEGRGSIPTSGSIPLPDHFAVGEVFFVNLTDQTVPLPENTVVSTLDDPPIRFATVSSTIVPPGDEGANVSIQAMQPGAVSNVDAESILAIEGPLGLALTVSNSDPTTGGTDRNAPAPNESDYQELYQQLYDTLSETALKEIVEKLEPDDLLLSEAAEFVITHQEDYTPADPSPTDQLQLVLRLEFRALMVSGQDLRELAAEALVTNLPSNFVAEPESLTINNITQPFLDQEVLDARWRMSAQWQIDAQLDFKEAINLAIGLSPEEAIDRLTDQMSLAEPAHITPRPTWWPRLPVLPFRISVSEIN